ncbi:MAG: hypothetical protein AAFZ06_04665, partial [Pseudomonadota bacterium]
QFHRTGAGPMSGQLSLHPAMTPISAMKSLKGLAGDRIDRELGAVSSRELDRLFDEAPALDLRAAA